MVHLCKAKNAQLGIIESKKRHFQCSHLSIKTPSSHPIHAISIQNQSKLLAQKTKNPIFFGGGVPFHGSVREINQPS
jgi:hypothetical protein